MNPNRKIVVSLISSVSFLCLIVAFLLLSYERTQAEKILYTGREHHVISLDKARRLTETYQNAAKPGDVIAGYLGWDIFQKILDQEECVGIRIYNAVSEAGNPTFVLVGVDTSGNDILGGPFGDEIWPCPPYCPSPGGLTLISVQGDIAMKK